MQLTDSTNQSWQEILEIEKMSSRRGFWRSKQEITQKETGAIIQMTIEFIKDMDMKMRDVYSVEKIYVRTYDFGAGKFYQDLEMIFKRMISLYKSIAHRDYALQRYVDLRSDFIGKLQIMLSEYCQFLSTVDQYKYRYKLFQMYSKTWDLRERIELTLVNLKKYPYGHNV